MTNEFAKRVLLRPRHLFGSGIVPKLLQHGTRFEACWYPRHDEVSKMPSDLDQPPSSPTHKQSRARVIQTCLPCHGAKRKCNRKKPCSQCLKRQMTGRCVYEAASTIDSEALEADHGDLASENRILRSRIADLEAAVAGFRAQLRDTRTNSSRKRTRTESDASATRTDREGVYYGRSFYLGGPAAPDLLRRMMSLVPDEQTDMLYAFSGGSNIAHSPASTSVYMFPTLFPASHGVKEMLPILKEMGKMQSDALLDAFYEIVDPLYHYVPTPWLMQRYERCWDEDTLPLAQEAALVFAVLALGDMVSNTSSSWFLIAASMQLLRISNFFTTPSMDSIHTFCFIAVYLQHEGKLSEYWPMLGMVIRLAQSMALHRDPSTISNLPPEEAEIRRRLFHTVAAQETALSVMFGRPNGIGYTDCKLPDDISDDELLGHPSDDRLSTANEISYNRYTWQLGDITRDMIEGAFNPTETDDMPRINSIESRIWLWYDTLPSPFKFDISAKQPEDFDTSASKKQYVQSLLLYIIVNHNILVLFRKPLLTCNSPASRKPCFEAAFAVAEGWKILQDNFPKMARVTWMHWFRAFHAALICMVAIQADGPRSEFRGRAINSWSSCLRIFAGLKDQNGSILSCWRALNRLDAVVKREMGNNRRAMRYSSQKQLRDSSMELLFSPTRCELNPVSPTARDSFGLVSEAGRVVLPSNQDDNITPSAQASCLPNLMDGTAIPELGPLVDTTPSDHQSMDFSETFAALPQFNIFDMDIQNWPSWLTAENSPDFT